MLLKKTIRYDILQIMFIQRKLKTEILQRLKSDSQAVILYGPRQSGKTSLALSIIEESNLRWLSLNGDNPEDASVMTSPTDYVLRGY